ncbi:hypothetical protein POTOM_060624 [Populus tomentosa]|uniref:Sister chromatid cohesion protein n=1 Tax=Populus tomentosa TaxID=118781 RepID=A0A8X8C0U4_POPTO|nr:hypothetical protein POTOM_060624 [Populus tomentosa]
MHEYLLDAESQMKTDKTRNNAALHPVKGSSSVPIAAGVELRQGLLHSMTCVPYLIALETDHQELMMNLNNKYPAFFESRLEDGLQLSFIFMQSSGSVSPENSNQKLQSKTVGNLKGESEGGSLSQAYLYCSEILALLPFTLLDEPVYLIYAINQIIQVRAGALEANLKGLILHLSQRNTRMHKREFSEPISHHMDLNGTIQPKPAGQSDYSHLRSFDLNGTDQEQPADHPVLSSSASRYPKMEYMSSGESLGISKDDVEKIQVDCLAAAALQLLLKLKRHLKIVSCIPNFTRHICQSFSPTEPPKPGEPLSRQNIPFDIINQACTGVPSTRQDLVQRHQEFKGALKEDTVDHYSAYTATIKRKRPTPRKLKSGRMMGDDEDDYDDEDWPGGGRRQGSGRKDNSSRGGRHGR